MHPHRRVRSHFQKKIKLRGSIKSLLRHLKSHILRRNAIVNRKNSVSKVVKKDTGDDVEVEVDGNATVTNDGETIKIDETGSGEEGSDTEGEIDQTAVDTEEVESFKSKLQKVLDGCSEDPCTVSMGLIQEAVDVAEAYEDAAIHHDQLIPEDQVDEFDGGEDFEIFEDEGGEFDDDHAEHSYETYDEEFGDEEGEGDYEDYEDYGEEGDFGEEGDEEDWGEYEGSEEEGSDEEMYDEDGNFIDDDVEEEGEVTGEDSGEYGDDVVIGDENDEGHETVETARDQLLDENGELQDVQEEEEEEAHEEAINDEHVSDEADEIVAQEEGESGEGPNFESEHGVDTDDVEPSSFKIPQYIKVDEGLFAKMKIMFGDIPLNPEEIKYDVGENSEKTSDFFVKLVNSLNNYKTDRDTFIADLEFLNLISSKVKEYKTNMLEFYGKKLDYEEASGHLEEIPEELKNRLSDESESFAIYSDEFDSLTLQVLDEFKDLESSFTETMNYVDSNLEEVDQADKINVVETDLERVQGKLHAIIGSLETIHFSLSDLESIGTKLGEIISELRERSEEVGADFSDEPVRRKHKLI